MERVRPESRVELDRAIELLVGADGSYADISAIVSSAVIARLLPEGAVKGGSSLRLRYGEAGTRFTTDVDVVRKGSLTEFCSKLERSLADGWEGFTGTLESLPAYSPPNVQNRYSMAPFLVRLSYRGQSWMEVRLEVGYNELGDANASDRIECPEISELFYRLGLPSPGALPLMPVIFQVSQKLHALSEDGSQRAHDLVDLQVITHNDHVDLAELERACSRLFRYRKAQPWPPHIESGEDWDDLYDDAAADTDVLPSVVDAVIWVNDLIDDMKDAATKAEWGY